jgi:hypothetical protein
MNPALVVLTVSVISASAAPARAQGTPRGSSVPTRSNIYKLEELTWPQIDALNRERTLFILPCVACDGEPQLGTHRFHQIEIGRTMSSRRPPR